jgi:hypothetical protein
MKMAFIIPKDDRIMKKKLEAKTIYISLKYTKMPLSGSIHKLKTVSL